MTADGNTLGTLFVAFDRSRGELSCACRSLLQAGSNVLGSILLRDSLARSLKVYGDLVRDCQLEPPQATVVVFTGRDSVRHARQLLHEGATTDLPQQLASSLLGPATEPLTSREQEVLRFMSLGLPNGEIAARLCLSIKTVDYHARHIYGKLGVHSGRAAVALAHDLKLI